MGESHANLAAENCGEHLCLDAPRRSALLESANRKLEGKLRFAKGLFVGVVWIGFLIGSAIKLPAPFETNGANGSGITERNTDRVPVGIRKVDTFDVDSAAVIKKRSA